MIKDNFTKDWHWWDYLESWWYVYFWNWFSEIPRNTKYFIQRGKRGWSDRDVWCMHHYLTDTILDMLIQLRTNHCGYPATANKTGKWTFDEKRWDKILQEMIEGFTILRKADNYEEDLHYAPNLSDDEERKRMEQSMRKDYPGWRFTTKTEDAKVKRAFELLQQHYQSLWD